MLCSINRRQQRATLYPYTTLFRSGAALVDCALFAGDQVGHGVVQELVLQSPLVVPEQQGVHLQVIVGREVPAGRWLSVYSRVEGVAEWPLNAQVTLVRMASPVAQPVGNWTPRVPAVG